MSAIEDVVATTANELGHNKGEVVEVLASISSLAKTIIENKQAPGIRLPFIGIVEFSEAKAKHRENGKQAKDY